MDDIDHAIRKTRQSSNQGGKELAPVKHISPLVLIGLALFVGGVLLIWAVRSWYMNREVQIYYSNIPQAKPIYTKMTKPLVHGEISGQVKDSRTNSMTLTFCLVKACNIYKKGSDYFLTGLKKDIKQVTVGSEGSFAQRLLPGVYYMNARGENGEVLEGVPVRIDVKAGQVSMWDIQVKMR